MLTDEELKELEAAAERFPGLRDTLLIQLGRDAIAREHAMRQPLTAEICERLLPHWETGYPMFMGNLLLRISGSSLVVNMEFSADIQEIENPTVGHLFAAALLAGVELDWRKVGE